MSVEIELLLKATGLALAAIYNLILAFEAWPRYWRFSLSAITAWILAWFAYQQLMVLLSRGA